MYRFFTDRSQIADGLVHITGEDVNHIRNVLRMHRGETVLISCGDEWEYTCEVDSLSEEEVTCRIVDAQLPGKELPSRIFLFQCLPKGDKMETVVQKAVELGAYSVIPVSSRRCIMKLDAKRAAQKTIRWNKIAESAAKQSKRLIIPEVHEIMTFGEALEYAGDLDVLLMPYEMESGMGETRRILSAIQQGQSVGVLIGPEGGFEEQEAEDARNHGFSTITLGKRILRTETAGMTILSILMYLLERD
ncbi:MAG: 16S rRNA (uracil(1498)-N(3))-methyltransferase [Bilifractor sp.]|nr:16S rRNA (uracil(1498)-N(3))-methyltransferase [Lachnospiraceae bacterium]MDY2838376.1 16S rRNA (uracil(1498)-N(3))-methyltransferase [Bilifractor sp.]